MKIFKIGCGYFTSSSNKYKPELSLLIKKSSMTDKLRYINIFFFALLLLASRSLNVHAEQGKRLIAKIDNDGIQQVEILAGSYFFNPNYIVIKVNVPVEVKIKRESGITPHNIVINAPEAGIEINESISTDPKILRFTPTKTGKQTFFCDKKLLFFKSHREKGMEGIIEVVP